MKSVWFTCLVVLAGLALAFPALSYGYSIEIKAQQQRVIYLTANQINPKVSVYVNDQLHSIQQGPNTLNSREFMVLGPFDTPSQISIKADINFPLSKAHQPVFIDVTPSAIALGTSTLNQQIDFYRKLSVASQWWATGNSDKRQQAIDLLSAQLQRLQSQKSQIQTVLTNEISYLLGAMLIANDKAKQGADLLESIEVNSSQPWHLSQLDSLLYRGKAHYWQRDFEPAILRYCDYFNQAGQSQQTYASLLVAQSLIERQRGVNQDKVSKFNALYAKHCSKLMSGFTASTKLVEDAKKLLERLLVNNKTWPQPQLQSRVFGQLWNYYTVTDDHIQAEKFARLAIDNYINTNDVQELASYYWYLGTSLLRQGAFKQAQQIWRKGLMLSGKKGGQNVSATSLFNLAYSYRAVGDYGLAKRYFTLALAADEKAEGPLNWQQGPFCNKDGIYSAMTLVQLVVLARIDGRIDEASTMAHCAQAVFENTNEYYVLLANLEIANVQLANGNTVAANLTSQQVLNDKRLMQPQRLDGLLVQLKVALSDNIHSDVETTANLLAMALDYDSINFAAADIHQNYPLRQIAFYQLLISHYGQNNGQHHGEKQALQQVEQFGEKALRLIETIKGQMLNTQAWSAAQYALLAEYVKALYHLDGEQNQEKIFRLLDRYYAINLNIDRETYQDQSTQLMPPRLAALWQIKLAAERELVGVSKERRAIVQQSVDRANEQFLAYRDDSDQAQYLSTQPKLSLPKIQQMMPKTDILLRYFIDQDLSFVMVVTKNDIDIIRLSAQEDVRAWVLELSQHLHQRNVRQKVMDTPLNDLLPLDLLQSGDYQRVVIIADDTLHQLPFSLLNMSKGQGYKALGANVAIVRTHSAQGFYADSERSKDTNEAANIVLFADPNFQLGANENMVGDDNFKTWLAGQPRLPYTATEATNIAKMFEQNSNSEVLVATGQGASNTFLLSDKARNANVLHIATHGYFDDQNPESVGLLTAGNNQANASYGFLGLSELLSKPFNTDLVVVSGCETMQGQYYKGSGTGSITRGLLAQGANAVIGTLWPIADRPTAKFMTSFYRHLLATDGDSEKALMLTKQQFAQRGRYRHPKYWAGFVLSATNQSLRLPF